MGDSVSFRPILNLKGTATHTKMVKVVSPGRRRFLLLQEQLKIASFKFLKNIISANFEDIKL